MPANGIASISAAGPNQWTVALSDTPDVYAVTAGNRARFEYTSRPEWDAQDFEIVSVSPNTTPRTITVENPAGVSIVAHPGGNAVGSASALERVDTIATVYGHSKQILFNAVQLNAAQKISIANPFVSVQHSRGIAVADDVLDWIQIYIVQCQQNPFRTLFEGVNAPLNIYESSGQSTFRTINPGTPGFTAAEYDTINLIPGENVVEKPHWPSGGNLLLESASSDIAEYRKIDLDSWAVQTDSNCLIIPITPNSNANIDLRWEVARKGNRGFLAVFASIGSEDIDREQRVKGRLAFNMEAA